MNAAGLIIGALIQLLLWGPAMAFTASDQVELTFEIAIQTAGGDVRTECRDSAIVQGFVEKRWWLEAANRQDAAGGEWTCGRGRPVDDDSDFSKSVEPPALFAEFTAVVRPIKKMEDERNVNLELSASLRERSHRHESGSPSYETSDLKRVLYFSDAAEATIPLLISSERNRRQADRYELFLRITATATAGREASPYGTIIVTSETSADLFLDGGLAARLSAGEEAILRNVRAGIRLLAARDANGRLIRKAVHALAGRTVLAELDMANSEPRTSAYALQPLGPNAWDFEEFRREIDQAVVVRIPAGEFLMGNEDTERSPLEHKVYVSDFMIDKTGVSWRQYKKFAAATGTPLPPAEPYWGTLDHHPAAFITWVEAKNYCEWVGGRLPTEAEREKAARGTDRRKYPWGNNEPEPHLAVFRKSWGHHSTAPVGTHPAGASPYGVLDMAGNVWEWCSDWYDGDYYAISPYRNPRGPATGNEHVVRGGSWDSRPTVLSASCRSWGHRGYRDGDFGFRCAMNWPRGSE